MPPGGGVPARERAALLGRTHDDVAHGAADDTRPGGTVPQVGLVVTVPEAEHLPDRPSWDCRLCGSAWPCGPAREHLLRHYTRTWVAIYASAQLSTAILDLPTTTPARLYDRFLSWTRAP